MGRGKYPGYWYQSSVLKETTTDTLNWGIIHIVHQPEVQQLLHAELDSVIGSDRLITLADRTALPYANATVNVT
jgi:cytochrome P450